MSDHLNVSGVYFQDLRTNYCETESTFCFKLVTLLGQMRMSACNLQIIEVLTRENSVVFSWRRHRCELSHRRFLSFTLETMRKPCIWWRQGWCTSESTTPAIYGLIFLFPLLSSQRFFFSGYSVISFSHWNPTVLICSPTIRKASCLS